MHIYDTDEPPRGRGGGTPGRPRQNPFDEYVWVSYRDNYAAQEPPKWCAFHPGVDDDVKRAKYQIRNAGRYLSRVHGERIGTQIREGADGVVSFRGVPSRRKRTT